VKSEYAIKLVNFEPGSNPAPKDVQEMTLAITKDTLMMDDQKKDLDVNALKPGSRVEVMWRFANDHLTEAIEIIQSNAGVKKAAWNYKEGYIVAKEDQRFLLVRKTTATDIKNKELQQILDDAQPDAIWIKVANKDDYESFVVGDLISITIDRGVDQSYPAQAAVNEIVRIGTAKLQ
jgi:hypothetical protein